ncbi:MAG TPA: hypothetical protein VIY07_18925 [Pseudolabrys sp.]
MKILAIERFRADAGSLLRRSLSPRAVKIVDSIYLAAGCVTESQQMAETAPKYRKSREKFGEFTTIQCSVKGPWEPASNTYVTSNTYVNRTDGALFSGRGD